MQSIQQPTRSPPTVSLVYMASCSVTKPRRSASGHSEMTAKMNLVPTSPFTSCEVRDRGARIGNLACIARVHSLSEAHVQEDGKGQGDQEDVQAGAEQHVAGGEGKVLYKAELVRIHTPRRAGARGGSGLGASLLGGSVGA